ncbi:unnamed protein product, partial [Sphacelaria rigidula]
KVVDRPTLTEPRRKRREYIQPQWILDSLNARMLLPVARYAPGATLPPHLSPFVDDAAEGYVPAYREELDKLRSAAEARRRRGLGAGQADPAEDDTTDTVTAAAGGDGNADPRDKQDEEAVFKRDLELERAGTTFSKAKDAVDSKAKTEKDGDDDNDNDNDDDDEEDEDGEGGSSSDEEEEEEKQEASPALETKQTEAQEHHELSKMMMSKKAKRLYGRMQHGLSKRREQVDRLKSKRKKLEAKYDTTPDMTSKKKKRKKDKKNTSKEDRNS